MANTRTRKTSAAKPETEAETVKPEAGQASEETTPKSDAVAAYEEQIAAMKRQIEEMQKLLMESRTPQVVQVAADVEKVQFLYMAEVCDENVYEVGPGGMYGRIVGKTGSFLVPKPELSRVMDTLFRLMLERRWIIVVSGMTDEEREAYGVDYKEGEVLTKNAFTRMLELGDKLPDIYAKLCEGHKLMVEKRFYEAWTRHDPHVTREQAVALNRLAKADGRADNAFSAVLKGMNAEDAE